MDDVETHLASILNETTGMELASSDVFVLFLDTAAAHRDNAVERGFSAEAAESMAVALHSGLVALYCTQTQQ